jgi:hypothetical protein
MNYGVRVFIWNAEVSFLEIVCYNVPILHSYLLMKCRLQKEKRLTGIVDMLKDSIQNENECDWFSSPLKSYMYLRYHLFWQNHFG